MPSDGEPQPPVIVPPEALDPDTLRSVVESFVLREGTDYGAVEYSLEQKVAHVLRQLQRGEARLLFDPNSETVQILPARDAEAQISSSPAGSRRL